MIRLRLFQTVLSNRFVRILVHPICTCKILYALDIPGGLKESVVCFAGLKTRVPLNRTSAKFANDNYSSIKIPRFLRKAKDKEQIERYYRVKKLCLEGKFDEAILDVEEWLAREALTTSTILILNGLLYSLFEQGKVEEIVRLKETMDSYHIKGDRSTYTVLIDSFGQMKKYEVVSKLLYELKSLNIIPHYRSYMIATELALEKRMFSEAIEYFLKIESIHKENHDEFCAMVILKLIEMKQVKGIESVFQDFRENRTRLGKKALSAIQKYFHSGLTKDKWSTTKTFLDISGICQCKEKLEEAQFGKPEENLSVYFEKLINNGLNTDISKKMTDKKMTRNNKLRELFRFLETEGPFDIVVDGLNVGMHPRLGLDLNMLCRLVDDYSFQGHKVLIIAANELIHPKRSKAVSIADHQKAMTYLKDISTVYFVKHNKSGIDDLFLINAALYLCRKDNNVKIVSNDKFMDHCVNMKPETICYFERWLSDHQVTVHWYNRTKMNLRGPKEESQFARVVQQTKDSWHFPPIDGRTWLCVKRI